MNKQSKTNHTDKITQTYIDIKKRQRDIQTQRKYIRNIKTAIDKTIHTITHIHSKTQKEMNKYTNRNTELKRCRKRSHAKTGTQ